MSPVTQTELQEFSLFLTEQVRSGVKMSPEEALDLWRAENPSDEEFEESVADLRDALDELAREPGIPLAELDRELRAKHRLPSP